MTDKPTKPRFPAGRVYRMLTGAFGLFLAGISIYALLFSGPSTMLQNVVAVVFVVLGGEMVFSACKGKESWLSGLGPLF